MNLKININVLFMQDLNFFNKCLQMILYFLTFLQKLVYISEISFKIYKNSIFSL